VADEIDHLAGLEYLDVDDDGVRLSGHAIEFYRFANSIIKELAAAREDTSKAGDVFDIMLP
jgi:hypothetical protein